jgi:signal transduction histidine kinase
VSPRPRSLFWVFAGVFLLVLAAASALQWMVSVGVLRPLAEAGTRERAGTAMAAAARALSALPDLGDEPAVRAVLRAHRVERVLGVAIYRAGDARLVAEPPLPPGSLRRTLALLNGVDDPRAEPEPPPGPDATRPGAIGPGGPQPGEVGTRRGPGGERPGEGGPPRGDWSPGPRDRRLPRLQVMARHSVVRGGATVGEVAFVGAMPGPGPRSLPEARALFLFFPFAVLAAGVAGLIMVRIVVRRLRALEQLAARVTEGDLSVRVEGMGGDEIGRLGERFNRMTERLAAVRHELDQADAQRRRLLADITHELSTPLTSIRGYVETLLDPRVETSEDERRGYLKDVLEEAQRLELLISDLFDLVRLEAGASPLRPVRLDWGELCRNTARRFEAAFRDAGLTLRWRGEPAPAWIRADGHRMEQVAENLLVNALRYVPAGGTVTLALEAAPGGRHRFTVADDGPGIAAADLPHVFERFYRADAVRATRGSGLGLAIVSEIIQRHGGTVRAERLAPTGAAFHVELPTAAG